jgi:hypothetical protein
MERMEVQEIHVGTMGKVVVVSLLWSINFQRNEPEIPRRVRTSRNGRRSVPLPALSSQPLLLAHPLFFSPFLFPPRRMLSFFSLPEYGATLHSNPSSFYFLCSFFFSPI